MTYLELLNRLISESGTSNQPVATVAALTGELARLKNYINDAYQDVQRKHPDWEWQRTNFSFTTVDAQQVYDLTDIGIATTFSRWKTSTFRLYITATGYGSETFLSEMPYDNFRDVWMFSTNRTVKSRPTVFSVAPDKSLAFGATPDSVGYTVVGDYYKMPVDLSVDADTPSFPARFHMLLVWLALQYYGSYESAPEAYDRGKEKAAELMASLEDDQLPRVTAGNALA